MLWGTSWASLSSLRTGRTPIDAMVVMIETADENGVMCCCENKIGGDGDAFSWSNGCISLAFVCRHVCMHMAQAAAMDTKRL